MWENPESNVTAFSSHRRTVLLLLTRLFTHAGSRKSQRFSEEKAAAGADGLTDLT